MVTLAYPPEKPGRECDGTRHWARVARDKFERFDGKGKEIEL